METLLGGLNMKSKNGRGILRAGAFVVVVTAAILSATITGTATAKSLYLIADINGDPTPLHAYDIAPDGTLTFQVEYHISRFARGAVGLAIDPDSQYLFVTYEDSDVIQLIDARTTIIEQTRVVPGASNLAGIVYDCGKRLLYCVDRGQDRLYVYDWQPQSIRLKEVPGSPFQLTGSTTFGIALDEINNLLYVANNGQTITVYSTSDWSFVKNVELSRSVYSVAVDAKNRLLYAGGGPYPGGKVWNTYLTQYNLAAHTETEVQVEPDGGVMGLAVDQATSLVYVSTGKNNEPGGDNLKIYDTSLNQIDVVHIVGNPTGIAIPIKDIGYNPLNLDKGIVGGIPDQATFVDVGQIITYSICFDNNTGYDITHVNVVDALPPDTEFLTADGDGISGQYDPVSHTYRWFYLSFPQGSSVYLDLLVRVNQDTAPGAIIRNFVTIGSCQTPPTTRSVDAVTEGVSLRPLHLSKTIVGGVGEQIEPVFPGDTITYRLCFDNNDNNYAVTNVSIVDALPAQVSFVTADGNGVSGQYDAVSHTYTWSYPLLAAGSGECLDLVVRVNQDAVPGTIITNSATIDSTQTAPVTSSVDAQVEAIKYNPLNLSKSIVGAVGDEIMPVLVGDTIKYRICFDNNDNTYAVTNVSIVDALPAQVSFVTADGDGVSGHYDAVAHTYTWSYQSLPAGAGNCLELSVQVKQDTASGTTISNFVTISSNQTTPTMKSAHAVAKTISYNPLNLAKNIVGAVVNGTFLEKVDCINPGDAITYRICFDNNDNDYFVTSVSIVDTLPTQMSFVTADGDGVTGHYDVNAHTYTWLYPFLLPEASMCLELVVQVNEDAVQNTVLSNSVTITSGQTPATTVHADVVTCEVPLQAELCVTPRPIRASSSGSKILAIVTLPPGIGKTDIADTPLILEPGSIVASNVDVYYTGNRVKILAFFDKAQLIKASGYGKVELRVVGKLKSGPSFAGEQSVSIAR